MLFMMEAGVGLVASRVEGHSFGVRLAGLLFLVVPSVLLAMDIFAEFHLVVILVAMIVVPWFVLMGSPVLVPGPYRKYARFGVIGRFAGRYLFYPGWVSGTPYVATIVVYGVLAIVLQGDSGNADLSKNDVLEMSYVFSALAMLPAQLCLVKALFQQHETDWAIAKVINVNIGLILLAFALGVAKVYFWLDLTLWTSFIPSSALIYAFFGAMDEKSVLEGHLLVSALGYLGIIIVLMFVGGRYSGRYQELESRAREIDQRKATED